MRHVLRAARACELCFVVASQGQRPILFLARIDANVTLEESIATRGNNASVVEMREDAEV